MKSDVINSNNTSGIYSIYNTINGSYYVGSSVCIKNRLTEHKRQLRLGIHHNNHLQASYNKYGKDVFLFEVIEYCDTQILLWLESYWIKMLNSKYNQKCPLQSLGSPVKIDIYTATGNFIITVDSILSAATYCGIDRSSVVTLCKLLSSSIKGFTCRYHGDIFKVAPDKVAFKITCKSKTVNAYTLDGKLINTYPSVSVAGKSLGINISTIYKICNNKLSTIKGFRFSYLDTPLEDIKSIKKEIIQLTLSGEYITTYSSVREAADSVNCTSTSISNVCKNKKKRCKGYLWQYKNNS